MVPGTLRGLIAIACLGGLTDCAVVQSQAVTSTKPDGSPIPDGIPYFLPRRPFIITVTNPQSPGLPPTLSVTAGAPEPDLSKRYVISQGTNLFADNEFNIAVSSNGLLQTSTSTATSEVPTIVQNAAASAGMLAPGGALALRPFGITPSSPQLPGPKLGCPSRGGFYQIVLYPEVTYPITTPLTLCDSIDSEGGPYIVTWHRADRAVGPFGGQGGDSEKASTTTPVSGLFFRHELPYVVTIRGPAIEIDTVIASPDESETDFFPVKRSFFANNTANIVAADGVITGVDQTTKSELAAAVGLPATWISSYTTAVGQLFSGLSTASSDQQKLLQQLISTSATKNQIAAVGSAQNQLCLKTVAGYNFTSMSAADMTTALAVIKTACPGPGS
jgi:hypothetical protein